MVKERADQGGSLGFNVSKRQRQKQSGNGGKIPDKSSGSKKIPEYFSKRSPASENSFQQILNWSFSFSRNSLATTDQNGRRIIRRAHLVDIILYFIVFIIVQCTRCGGWWLCCSMFGDCKVITSSSPPARRGRRLLLSNVGNGRYNTKFREWPWKVVQWWWEGGRQRGCQDWSWSRCQPWSPTLNICIIGKEHTFN